MPMISPFSKTITEPEDLRKERLRMSKTTSEKVIPNKKKSDKEKYKNFLESLNTEENSSLIGYLKVGFDVCFEGVDYQVMLNCLHVINRCVAYLEKNGNDFSTGRLAEYLNKLSRISNNLENDYKRNLSKLLSSYSLLDCVQILEFLKNLKEIILQEINPK